MLDLKRHHVLYILLATALMVGIIFVLYPKPSAVSLIAVPTGTSTVAVASSTGQMRFEVVTTNAAQARGLGGREDVPENFGMLFVFANPARVGFWMKDMLTPIDMIWLSDNGTILKIDASVAPNTYPKTFYPPEPVQYVLETRAREAERRGWEVGTHVQLPSPYGA